MLAAKPASSRQIANIERLRTQNRESRPAVSEDITSQEVSKIIQKLMAEQNRAINEPQLGMAMKECFRLWTGYGRDVYGNRRKQFIEQAIETYWLFTEVADKLNSER